MSIGTDSNDYRKVSTMSVPTISHPTDRPNFTVVSVGDRTYYFSYRTCVGFHTPDTGTVVRQNDWSTTTGKHLNYIDGGTPEAKRVRLTGEAFRVALPCGDWPTTV